MAEIESEVRQSGVWTFEIRKQKSPYYDTEEQYLGTFTDTVDRKRQIYINRDKKTLHRPGKKPTPIKARIYWDIYTGGRATGEVPFWIAEDFAPNATVENIVATFIRAESFGSEWCMMDYEIRATVADVYLESIHFQLPSDTDEAETAAEISVHIENLRGIVHDLMRRYEAAFAAIKEDEKI